jgi:hypothetical protein
MVTPFTEYSSKSLLFYFLARYLLRFSGRLISSTTETTVDSAKAWNLWMRVGRCSVLRGLVQS